MDRKWLILLFLLVLGVLLLQVNTPEPVTLPPESQTVEATVPEPANLETTVPETQIPTVPQETLPPETAPEKTVYDYVPLYYQTDYPHVPYGNGTIATSGCGITCLAMVATYLTDREYTPPQLAQYFGAYGDSNMDRLNYGIQQMQLPCEFTTDADIMLESVREGKVVIALMNEASIFTTEQHFIAVTGTAEGQRFWVNDPLEANYTHGSRHMKESFEIGFSHIDLRAGFSGGWIFDKAAMPAEPYLYEANLPQPRESRYASYALTDEDIYTLACFVWAEAREESPEVKQAVTEVVLNRVLSPDHPDTVWEILETTELSRALEAMSWVEEPGLEQYLAVDAAMYGPYVLPEDVFFYSQQDTGYGAWGSLGNYIFYHWQ